MRSKKKLVEWHFRLDNRLDTRVVFQKLDPKQLKRLKHGSSEQEYDATIDHMVQIRVNDFERKKGGSYGNSNIVVRQYLSDEIPIRWESYLYEVVRSIPRLPDPQEKVHGRRPLPLLASSLDEFVSSFEDYCSLLSVCEEVLDRPLAYNMDDKSFVDHMAALYFSDTLDDEVKEKIRHDLKSSGDMTYVLITMSGLMEDRKTGKKVLPIDEWEDASFYQEKITFEEGGSLSLKSPNYSNIWNELMYRHIVPYLWASEKDIKKSLSHRPSLRHS